jgi:hypothetical protein
VISNENFRHCLKHICTLDRGLMSAHRTWLNRAVPIKITRNTELHLVRDHETLIGIKRVLIRNWKNEHIVLAFKAEMNLYRML